MKMHWMVWVVVFPVAAAGIRERGAGLEAEGRWDEAVQLYRSALDELPAAETATRLWLLTSLGEISFNRQDYNAAERWLHEAEQVDLPANAPARIPLLTARGTLHLVRGNLTAAQKELARAVELTISAGQPEDRAAAVHNLAGCEMQMGDLDRAEVHEREALAIWTNRLGERHEYVLKAWISLSSLQGLRSDWSAAEDSLRHALAIRESNEALANYAIVLEKLKRGKEAKAIRARLQGAAVPVPSVVDVKSRTPIRSR